MKWKGKDLHVHVGYLFVHLSIYKQGIWLSLRIQNILCTQIRWIGPKEEEDYRVFLWATLNQRNAIDTTAPTVVSVIIV